MSLLLTASDFTRLEPGNPGPRQLGDGWCMTDCRDWGRFISKATFKMPVQIDVDAQVHRFYSHSDARPYDGISFLWGAPANSNDRNYNINMLKRDPNQAGGNRWQEEVKAHDYEGRGGYKPTIPWQTGESRTFQFLLTNPPLVKNPETEKSNRALQMVSDGRDWIGYTTGQAIATGKILIRADRCLAQWRVHVQEGKSTMTKRISGNSRYATAASISRTRFPDGGADVVYLASGVNYPDALAAGPMATDGPILYAQRDSLPKETSVEIERLKPKRIVVLGGRGVISDSVAQQADRAAN